MANKKYTMKEMDAGLLDAYIGKRLKLRRIMLRMSQDELASMVGVTFQQVQKYEKGLNRVSASRLWDFSVVLNIPVSFFFEDMDKSINYIDKELTLYGLKELYNLNKE